MKIRIPCESVTLWLLDTVDGSIHLFSIVHYISLVICPEAVILMLCYECKHPIFPVKK